VERARESGEQRLEQRVADNHALLARVLEFLKTL
jgi:hypothetical protein